ncbi:flavin reductase [Mesorhizobium sp. AR10]|uniref:flavin reductase n=1 Tax=Mesorhizobium sp. AR10 TaxID=2865839 RepID=UPI00215DE828|nr:flavin reductase [Mesorhizobium sp. AR10]UVK41465.1 flavin reductase [Mesorhizobium sp. AR10]
MLMRNAVEPRSYREAMSLFAGAVQILTTDGSAGRRGATVIAACSVSDEPPTVLVCLSRKSARNDLFAANGVFALNTLGAPHADLAHAFSGMTDLDQQQRFAFGTWTTLASGAPVLEDAISTFDCEVTETREVATHRVLFGRVIGLRFRHADGLDPLIYHKRGYHVL